MARRVILLLLALLLSFSPASSLPFSWPFSDEEIPLKKEDLFSVFSAIKPLVSSLPEGLPILMNLISKGGFRPQQLSGEFLVLLKNLMSREDILKNLKSKEDIIKNLKSKEDILKNLMSKEDILSNNIMKVREAALHLDPDLHIPDFHPGITEGEELDQSTSYLTHAKSTVLAIIESEKFFLAVNIAVFGVVVANLPIILTQIGFTSSGIAAGSWAAKLMSSAALKSGGGVLSIKLGGIIAACQSIGATGSVGWAALANLIPILSLLLTPSLEIVLGMFGDKLFDKIKEHFPQVWDEPMKIAEFLWKMSRDIGEILIESIRKALR